MTFKQVTLIVVALFVFIGCSGGSTLITQPLDSGDNVSTTESTGSASISNRVLWGTWDVSISADHSDIALIPNRLNAFHLNLVDTLENQVCTDCLELSDINILPADILEAKLTLTHPFGNNLKTTAFDVRAILVTPSNFYFPEADRYVALGGNVLHMLNPDGYTALFNPTEFPENLPVNKIFKYVPGAYSPGGDLSATLVPFQAFQRDEPRRMFGIGTVASRIIKIQLPPDPLEFGYAVDASWIPVTEEITDPLVDFPPEANCMEAYRIGYSLIGTMTEDSDSTIEIKVAVADHQGLETIDSVTVEAPDLFPGVVQLQYSGVITDSSWIYAGSISNSNGAAIGNYPLLIEVNDIYADPNLGGVPAWQSGEVTLSEGSELLTVTWGDNALLHSYDVAVGPVGNALVSGCFRGLVDFDPGQGTTEYDSNTLTTAYLVEFNDQLEFTWIYVKPCDLPGDDFEFKGAGVSTDIFGNVYWAGYSHNFPGVSWSAFFHKFDINREMSSFGNPGNVGYDIRVDDFGYVYALHKGPPNFSSESHMSKFTPAGEVVWSTERNYLTDLQCWAVDGEGYSYFTGYRENDSGNDDFYLCKIDPDDDGSSVWKHKWGGPDDDRPVAIDLDNFGNIYLTGNFKGTTDFDPGDGIAELTSNGETDIFLSKFDENGNFLWAYNFGGLENDKSKDIVLGSDGFIYTVGWIWNSADLDPGPGEFFFTPESGSGSYISRFDQDGNWLGSLTYDSIAINACALDSTSNTYITGEFNGTVDFDPGDDEDLRETVGISEDCFLSRIPRAAW